MMTWWWMSSYSISMIQTLKNYLELCFTYYTFRAIGLHGLHLLWLIPSTRIIAVFVCIVSLVFLLIYPWYYKIEKIDGSRLLLETTIHWIRPFILPISFEFESIVILIISYGLYVLVHSHKDLYRWYITHHESSIEEIINKKA